LIAGSAGNFARIMLWLKVNRVIFIPIKIIYVLVVKNVLKNVLVDFLIWFNIYKVETAPENGIFNRWDVSYYNLLYRSPLSRG
jgi:hypothetical protein